MSGISNAAGEAKRAAAALCGVAGVYCRDVKRKVDEIADKASDFIRLSLLFVAMIFTAAWIWHPIAEVLVPLLVVGVLGYAFYEASRPGVLEVFAGIEGIETVLANPNHTALVKSVEESLHKLRIEVYKALAWLCALGMYLAFVPISNHRIYAIWLLVVIVGIIFSGEVKLLRRIFIVAFAVLTVIFFGLPDIKPDTTPKFAVTYQPQHWGCGAKRSDLDLFAAPDKLIGPYYPADDCFAKLVLPGHSHHWHLQTAGAKVPGDWLAIACTDGRVVVPPQDPDSGARFGCNYNDGREENTFLFQGHVASGITFITQ